MENKIDLQMPEKDYRSFDALNYSHLKLMSKPFLYKQMVLEGKKQEFHKSLSIGTAVHIKVLEPHKEHLIQNLEDHGFTDRKKWQQIKKMQEANPDVLYFSQKEIDSIDAMTKSVKLHDKAKELYTNTWNECSIFWTDKEHKIDCKARIDSLNVEGGYAVDLKTTKDAEGFMKEAVKYGYHIQAAFYLRGLKALTGKDLDWYWVAVDVNAPHFCYIYKLSDQSKKIGEFLIDQYITKLEMCRRDNHWPIGNEEIRKGELPTWYVEKMTAAIEGEKYNEFRNS